MIRPQADDDLCARPACDLVVDLRAGRIDPRQLVDAAFARMDRLDGVLNAVPTRLADRAWAACERIRDERTTAASEPRWLGGLPIVVKDTHPVAGARTTYGSRAFADHVPDHSAWHVEQLERMGAIVIGKSNTPEFAAGAQTFNDVHGTTCNPWNTGLTCGGSSGGAAVAVAAGMAWGADGSDLGGSLRIPAAFCGVVGLRPSVGRVRHGPQRLPFQTLNQIGPIARSVRDLALVLDAMSGPDARDPLCLPLAEPPLRAQVERDPGIATIGFDPDLGGRIPVDAAIARVLRAALGRLGPLGVEVRPVSIATDDAIMSFRVLRAQYLAAELGEIAERHRALLKPELVANIDEGLALDGARIAAGERARGVQTARLLALLDRYPVVALPTTIMPPFDKALRYPRELDGRPFENYFDWVAPTFVLSLTGCPTLSLPCGLTDAGLPVGLQLVAAPHEEGRLLAFAARLERAFGFPPLPIG